ncbi:hypothetical protein [Macrococcoides caseolyticum]|nr:hypothetical protein [Macrococcus caseolyticus]
MFKKFNNTIKIRLFVQFIQGVMMMFLVALKIMIKMLLPNNLQLNH